MSNQVPREVKPEPAIGGVDLGRRRFGRKAAPVVLGSLLSQPVLAGKIPYHCTISGGLSGNVSMTGDGPVNCNSLGKSPGYYKNNAWPVGVGAPTKGTSNGGGGGTVFNGFTFASQSLPGIFFYQGGTTYQTGDAAYIGGGVPATLLQVLRTTGGNNGTMVYAFARITVATILNCYANPSGFPLTPERVIAMFNAVYTGGTYAVNATTSWNLAKVQQYFDYLNDGGTFDSPF